MEDLQLFAFGNAVMLALIAWFVWLLVNKNPWAAGLAMIATLAVSWHTCLLTFSAFYPSGPDWILTLSSFFALLGAPILARLAYDMTEKYVGPLKPVTE